MALLGCPWPARRWFRLLWCLVAVAFIALLPVLIIELKNEHIPVHRQVILIYLPSQSKYLGAIPVIAVAYLCNIDKCMKVTGIAQLSDWSLILTLTDVQGHIFLNSVTAC